MNILHCGAGEHCDTQEKVRDTEDRKKLETEKYKMELPGERGAKNSLLE